MITRLRSKLFLGLVPLLIIMVALGLWAVAILDRLGGGINTILHENYESILAAQGMKDSLERMNSAILLAPQGLEAESRRQFRLGQLQFDRSLEKEQHNITVPGEQGLVNRLFERYGEYLKLADHFYFKRPGFEGF